MTEATVQTEAQAEKKGNAQVGIQFSAEAKTIYDNLPKGHRNELVSAALVNFNKDHADTLSQIAKLQEKLMGSIKGKKVAS